MPQRFSFSRLMFWVGIAFLYVPMLVLVVYSFNESRLVTVWAGFSGKWYVELFQDQQIMTAVWRSLQIAFLSASAAVVLAILGSLIMVRHRNFKGRTLFSGMITAPLVMPDVIIGLSMLLLFVAMGQMIGWPENRGMLTVWIAHTTFCLAYSTVVISSRLREMDRSLEEASLDLGANQIRTFFQVTLPIIAPAIVSAWLLSFTLSLDDVVIASFVTGPGATTLPIEVFSSVRLGVTPKINALATLIIAAVSLVAIGSWYLTKRMNDRVSAQLATS
ncbi:MULTISPECIES: ABC transporter permease subunit [Marinobacter]|uniref:ABC transporter permease subunit n=1 Tax=Marinobacter suaedae TaxID=3057675 RepID=A0ABT8VXX4_9GAMM|nr:MULTISPECIES: ABC transporter permease subunit [unclassified Marinobacter]MBZ2168959.1 ABC transporter permease subunit [Marinobacter sp. F4216]MDO3720845.1 ABC transporter permease subunit [Marinobacter sp. chi1]